MLRYTFLSIIILSLLVIFSSCQNTEQPIEQNSLNDSPDFLLMADEDPLDIEVESAFMIDAAGPLYFSVLDLTDEQKEQIKEIVSELKPQFGGLRERWKDGTSWEEIREERRALREKINEAIYEILTDEQRTILDEIKTQLENGEYPDLLVVHKVAHLNEMLNLSEDQQTELSKLFKEYGTILIAYRDDSGNRFEFMRVKFELFMELDGKVRDLLTEEQLVLYDEFKSEHKRKRLHHHRRP